MSFSKSKRHSLLIDPVYWVWLWPSFKWCGGCSLSIVVKKTYWVDFDQFIVWVQEGGVLVGISWTSFEFQQKNGKNIGVVSGSHSHDWGKGERWLKQWTERWVGVKVLVAQQGVGQDRYDIRSYASGETVSFSVNKFILICQTSDCKWSTHNCQMEFTILPASAYELWMWTAMSKPIESCHEAFKLSEKQIFQHWIHPQLLIIITKHHTGVGGRCLI